MVDAWPASLPSYLLVDGYSEGIGDGRVRSQTDMGPPKVRRRSSAMPKTLQGRMLMTGAQLATLQSFVETTLVGGSLPFTFTDPVTRGSILVRFAGSLPSWTGRGGDTYAVALELEVLP